jgi:hypothetical protein
MLASVAWSVPSPSLAASVSRSTCAPAPPDTSARRGPDVSSRCLLAVLSSLPGIWGREAPAGGQKPRSRPIRRPPCCPHPRCEPAAARQ